ncbi:MAG: S-layer homology domain-containing protein, partial [Clostridia bacterium]|nr:S-layer homology domain-containing protein [Clostridia bacterium]
MKKLISLLICICLAASAFTALANDIYIELDPLEYDEYMRGETIFVRGETNTYVTLGLYYPEHYGSSAKYIMTYSPDELAEGVYLETDTEERLWPDGVWTIIVQSGDVSESLEFTLCEVVDRTEEPTEKPTKKPTGGDVPTVTPITPEKTKLTLSVGESEKINIDTTASSLSVEIEDGNVIDASISGKTLTVTALRVGTSTIWVKTSNNYANIKVTVTPRAEVPTEEPTETPTEDVTEPPTENDIVTENPFTDLSDDHWAKDSVLTLYAKGVVNGMDEDTFAPNDNVTRAQFVTMLVKAFGFTMKSAASPFGDVTEDDWYFASVMAAYENGIAQGDYAGNFNPNSLITRQDMATLAYRAARAAGVVLPISEPLLFDDHSQIKDYAVEAVYSMRSAG